MEHEKIPRNEQNPKTRSSAPPTAVRKKLLMAPHLPQGLCHSSNCIPKEWGYRIPAFPRNVLDARTKLPSAENNPGPHGTGKKSPGGLARKR